MDESYFKDRLSAYLDGELTPEETLVVEQYLEESEEARQMLADMKKLYVLTDSYSKLNDDEYWERSAQAIEKALEMTGQTEVVEVPVKESKGWIWKTVSVAASICLLTYIGLHQSDILKDDLEPVAPVYQEKLESPRVSEPEAAGEEELDLVAPGWTDPDEADGELGETPGSGDEMRQPLIEAEESTVKDLETTTAGEDHRKAVEQPAMSLSKEESGDAAVEVEEKALIQSPSIPPVHSVDSEVKTNRMAIPRPVAEEPPTDDADIVDNLGKIAAPSLVAPITDSNYKIKRVAPQSLDFQEATEEVSPDEFIPNEQEGYLAQPEPVVEYSQAQIDSLLAFYRAERAQSQVIRAGTAKKTDSDSNRSVDRARGKTKPSIRLSNLEAADNERRLLKACYEIALWTPDDDEYTEVVKTITEIAGDPSSPNQNYALGLLDKLENADKYGN